MNIDILNDFIENYLYKSEPNMKVAECGTTNPIITEKLTKIQTPETITITEQITRPRPDEQTEDNKKIITTMNLTNFNLIINN